jgi:prepilin-type N-terminal cleavage/methylation domain-containing protein
MCATGRIAPARVPLPSSKRGLTLTEVLVAAGIFAIVATTLVGVFLQNQRYSHFLGYRTQAVTTALSILEQLRFQQYAEVADIYNAGAAGTISVTIADPAELSGYRDIVLPVNMRDQTEYQRDWTSTTIVVDPDADAPRLPIRFFLHLTRNLVNSGSSKIDVFEIVLLYQWPREGRSSEDWHTGNVRLVVPNLNNL